MKFLRLCSRNPRPGLLRVLPALLAVGAIGSVALLSACSGEQNNASTLPASGTSQVRDLIGSGVPLVPGPLDISQHAKVEHDVFVSNGGPAIVILKDRNYKEVGTITNGITAGYGVWADSNGNLYVANEETSVAGNVVEYQPGGTSPSCTYSAGLTDPIDVTTDKNGNVYVADFQGGVINEYAQCSNSISKSWSVGSPEGVAVDKKGDLFVSHLGFGPGQQFYEFVRGKSEPTQLGATVKAPGGLIIDSKGNLIADDQTGYIYVIAPPYGTATAFMSGLQTPSRCALNRKEDLLFSSNVGNGSVTVYSYPSGTHEYTITSNNGIDGVEGVAVSPNAVL